LESESGREPGPATLAAPSARLEPREPGQRIALCLSGGGYRAMLFHLGTLWRLNELGYLPKLDRVSSVSGGSITAGVLAKRWHELSFDEGGVASNFDETVAADLLALAGKTIDVWAVLAGLLSFGSIADRVAAAYRRRLFGALTLQGLPEHPQFVINATNLQSGELWRFSKARMADYRVGQVLEPEVDLAVAVAASSAFPPILSPLRLKLDPGEVVGFPEEPPPALAHPPYTTRIVLSDGGVYDNLGLQQATGFPVVLVSDGGAKIADEPRPSSFWPLQLLRVLDVIDNQVRAQRTEHLVASYTQATEPVDGAYWGIRTLIADYHVDTLPAPPERTRELAATPTRLARLSQERRHRLVNWGYAVCDAAMRAYVLPQPPGPPPPGFPLPDGV
jgi:NTE family protein